MLERGVADAITFPWGSIGLFGIDKAVKYHMRHAAVRHALRLGDEQGQVRRLSAGAEEGDRRPLQQRVGQKVGGAWADFEFAGRAKIAAQAGHEVYKLAPDQLDAWRKAAAPSEAQWAEAVKKAGEDPKAVLDALKASLAKYKSAQ
jgi:hypothetical protein